MRVSTLPPGLQARLKRAEQTMLHYEVDDLTELVDLIETLAGALKKIKSTLPPQWSYYEEVCAALDKYQEFK
jgi:hypothetical protein